VIDQHNVMRYADAPLLAEASRDNLAAPALLSALSGPGPVSPTTQTLPQAN
jgi:hypothetical protein